MNIFQLGAVYSQNKQLIEDTKDLAIPLLDAWLERADQLTANIKALREAFQLQAPAIKNPEQFDVTWIQQTLARDGIPCSVTGEYDEGTKTAVMQFQQKYHLDADGWVGPLTAEHLARVA